MQIGGIGSGNSGLDNQGVSGQKTDRRIGDPQRNERAYDTAGRGVEEKTTSAYAVSISSEGKRLAAERIGTKGMESEGEGQTENGDGQELSQGTPETGGALFDRLKSLLQSGKDLLQQLWTGGAGEQHEAQIAAGTANVQAPASMASADPYFNNTSDAGKVKEPLMARIRIRFRDITDQLSERFGGMLSGQFFAGSELKDRQEQKKDNLQAEQAAQEKHKKEYYRKNGVVVDISTPPAEHLMDSYDKAGEYSRLTTEQKR